MQVAMNPTTVTDITSAELRDYLKTEHESAFVLIDVRQSEEYMDGHIPGARLIPLNELESYADELKQLSNRRLIFYCRSGGRSARASAWASRVLRLPEIYNLVGGFLGWDGQVLVDFPRLTPFDLQGSAETLLRRALELEKGTYLLYTQLATEYKSGVLAETLSGLVNAELQHGQAVHLLLGQIAQQGQPSFEQAFADMPGSIIENGMSLDVVLGRARELGAQGELALLELALEIELGAYDLYKNLATTVASEEAQHAIGELAQQEKAHANRVIEAIGRAAHAMSRIAS